MKSLKNSVQNTVVERTLPILDHTKRKIRPLPISAVSAGIIPQKRSKLSSIFLWLTFPETFISPVSMESFKIHFVFCSQDVDGGGSLLLFDALMEERVAKDAMKFSKLEELTGSEPKVLKEVKEEWSWRWVMWVQEFVIENLGLLSDSSLHSSNILLCASSAQFCWSKKLMICFKIVVVG